MSLRFARNAAGFAALLCLIAACGGGGASSSTPPSSGSPPPPSVPTPPVPEPIQGVATPSSVSVVTATNAN